MSHASAFPYSFGPLLDDHGAQFRLWAPGARSVELIHEGEHAMDRRADGWFVLHKAGCRAGTRYKFRIDGEVEIPDPASAFQPDDILGPSEIIDHGGFSWRSKNWRGRPWEEVVFLELHVGTFTPGGTFRSAIDKLDHCVQTGVTAIELMPVADFAGRWNWGYDGVLLYAPDSSYGRPDDLKSLVDAAHERGLMVFLDVVYNHFGPEGNFLPRYAPKFFCEAQTPWGHAIDYGLREVRAYAIENAIHWLDHYRFDGLRLDAVHAIVEAGEPPVLRALSEAVGAYAEDTGRHIHLVLENDDNAASLLSGSSRRAGTYRAQWNDDYHHAWHVLLTEEADGYYTDYAPDPLTGIERALKAGFIYQGEPSRHRDGRRRGEPSGKLPPVDFVNFLQNHDQIGNRALGDRLESLAEPAAIEAALAILLLAPMVPLLFMGEEWGSTQAFPFFCDFKGDLADAVRRGRRAEFSDAYSRYGDEVPDPLAQDTFRLAKLDWNVPLTQPGKDRLALVTRLLKLRAAEVVPRLTGATFGACHVKDGVVRADWLMGDGQALRLLANLSSRETQSHEALPGRVIFGEDRSLLPPWSVIWSVGARP
jgi:maltooligosyltrehalose trehalohydrolase